MQGRRTEQYAFEKGFKFFFNILYMYNKQGDLGLLSKYRFFGRIKSHNNEM